MDYLLSYGALLSSLFYYSYKGLPTAYYQLSSRLFEFLVGSCIVFTSKQTGLISNSGFLSDTFSNGITALAVTILIYIAMKSNVSVNFPNVYALFVCCATAILIKMGTSQNPGSVMRVFSNKMIVFIGLISYSVYIWHWPIFAFKHYKGLPDTFWVTTATFTVIFVISYCSWRFIEKPARGIERIKPIYTVFILFLLPTAFLHLTAYVIKAEEGFPQRFTEFSTVYQKLKEHNSEQRTACLAFENIKVSEQCTLGSHHSTSKKGFMIGDSFSNHYWRFMEYLSQKSNVSVTAHATGSCLTLPGISQYYLSSSRVYNECRQQTERYYNMIKENHYDYVIIAESWNGYLDNIIVDKSKNDHLAKQQMETALNNALQLIINAGSRPVLIKAIALRPKGDPYRCFLNHIKHNKPYEAGECDYTIPSGHQSWIDSVFAKMQLKYPQLIVIDPQKVLCDENQCKADINNLPVFRDAAHLTDYASYELAKRYLKHYKNPLLG